MPLQTLIMSADHIAAQGGSFEPQRANNGLLFIEGLTIFGDTAPQGNSVVTLAIESFPMPKQRNDPIELPFLNQSRKVAGQGMVDAMEVVLRDFVDQPVLTVLQNWRNSVYDPISGRLGLASTYKREAFAHLISPDGAKSRAYKLEGVWPSMVDPGDIDMNNPEKSLINMTLEVDKAYPIDIGHLLRGTSLDWGTPLRFLNQIAALASVLARS